MPQHSLSRLVGSTNLERKCRWLFGVSLLLLIGSSFWLSGATSESMVYDKNRSASRFLVDAVMLKKHWYGWETTNQEMKALVKENAKSLEVMGYDWKVLKLPGGDDGLTDLGEVEEPGDKNELAKLEKLSRAFEQHLARKQRNQLAGTESPSDASTVPPPGSRAASPLNNPLVVDPNAEDELSTEPVKNIRPVWDEREVRDEKRDSREYQFYQAVYWKRSCISCHTILQQSDQAAAVLANGDPERLVPGAQPFRVIKVSIPDPSTKSLITRNRIILLTTAGVTVYLSMLALWAVVRYVIVKPLYHLREVSEEVGRGNYDIRADIQTRDEFEDLARSFNRMLRHLIETQDQLRETNAQRDIKVDELAQANMQLYEMNRVKSDFLANMSHELRTPLNSIIGFSDVLHGISSLTDKQQRYVRNIGQSGRVLLDMINDILDLAKMESGKMELRLTDFSVAAIVQAQCDIVRSLADSKNIDLRVECPSDWSPMHQDQAKFQQILTNLLSNAIRFTPEGGRIVVTASRAMLGPATGNRTEAKVSSVEVAGDNSRDDPTARSDDDDLAYLLLAVADTGVGIAETDREAIFEKFRQATATRGSDNLTREYSGTGLGLSIVRELCKLLGGEITFESQLGTGSTFTVRLPWRHKRPHAGPDSPRSRSQMANPNAERYPLATTSTNEQN